MVSDETDGAREALAAENGDGLHRLRPDRVEPARRLAADGDGAGAPAALRPHADCACRRRHRDDRRSQRQVAGARPAVDRAGRTQNVVGIRAQLERFLDFSAAPNAARIVNNADWLGAIDMLTFLRDVGKHFSIDYMLQKESVSRRLESEDGISYTEFSYLILQSYDFLQLVRSRRLHACRWAAATSGATSPRAPISSARCAARRRTAWCGRC